METLNQLRIWSSFLVLVAPTFGLSATAPISTSCAAADAVVVGKVDRRLGAPVASLTVLDVIKGHPAQNTRLSVQLPSFRADSLDTDDELTAIVFLKQDPGQWTALSPLGENAPLRDSLLPATDGIIGGTGGSWGCEDKVLARALPGIKSGNIAWQRLPLLAWFQGYDSELYRDQLSELSHALNPELKALGIEDRFALGDVGALQQLTRDAAQFSPSTLLELGLTLQSFRGTDPESIAELGRIAALSDAKYIPLVRGRHTVSMPCTQPAPSPSSTVSLTTPTRRGGWKRCLASPLLWPTFRFRSWRTAPATGI